MGIDMNMLTHPGEQGLQGATTRFPRDYGKAGWEIVVFMPGNRVMSSHCEDRQIVVVFTVPISQLRNDGKGSMIGYESWDNRPISRSDLLSSI